MFAASTQVICRQCLISSNVAMSRMTQNRGSSPTRRRRRAIRRNGRAVPLAVSVRFSTHHNAKLRSGTRGRWRWCDGRGWGRLARSAGASPGGLSALSFGDCGKRACPSIALVETLIKQRSNVAPGSACSMLEQKLRVIEQRPEQVLGGESPVTGRIGECRNCQVAFGRIRITRQCREEELFHDRVVVRA